VRYKTQEIADRLREAREAKLPRKLVLDTARETVALFMERWETEKANLPMHKDVAEAIGKHLATLPIVTGKE
jgi:serine/threonine-protein kinase HipA